MFTRGHPKSHPPLLLFIVNTNFNRSRKKIEDTLQNKIFKDLHARKSPEPQAGFEKAHSMDAPVSSPELAHKEAKECKTDAPTSSWLTAKSGRKKRCPYTKHQPWKLSKSHCFNTHCLLNLRAPPKISPHVNLSDRQVKIWFQNRRMKLKKMNRENRIRELTSNLTFS
ncbi:unnamed protein product [Knipowitschia caucasica]